MEATAAFLVSQFQFLAAIVAFSSGAAAPYHGTCDPFSPVWWAVFPIYFWQFLIWQWVSYLFVLAEEPGAINYDWQSAGPPGGSEYSSTFLPQFVQALFTVYLLHELNVTHRTKKKYVFFLRLFLVLKK